MNKRPFRLPELLRGLAGDVVETVTSSLQTVTQQPCVSLKVVVFVGLALLALIVIL